MDPIDEDRGGGQQKTHGIVAVLLVGVVTEQRHVDQLRGNGEGVGVVRCASGGERSRWCGCSS